LGLVGESAGVWRCEGQYGRVVEVGITDVAAWSSAILEVLRRNLDKGILRTALCGDRVSESSECLVGSRDGGLCLAIVVLNFLNEHQVGRIHKLDDLRGDERDVLGARGHVFDIVGTKSNGTLAVG